MSYSSRRISLAAALAVTLLITAASPVLADEVAGQVKAVRSDQLAVDAGADRVAGGSAAAIAAAGTLFHADLSGLLGPCTSVAEIVGTGPDVPSVFSEFRNSPSHWTILTNPGWTAMGTGLATDAQGAVYVSVVFCARSTGSTSTEPPPSPPATEPPEEPQPDPEPDLEKPEPEPPVTIQGTLPAVGARRGEIRARLDGHAEAMLPAWYTGMCGTDDRERVLAGTNADSGVCPLAH